MHGLPGTCASRRVIEAEHRRVVDGRTRQTLPVRALVDEVLVFGVLGDVVRDERAERDDLEALMLHWNSHAPRPRLSQASCRKMRLTTRPASWVASVANVVVGYVRVRI